MSNSIMGIYGNGDGSGNINNNVNNNENEFQNIGQTNQNPNFMNENNNQQDFNPISQFTSQFTNNPLTNIGLKYGENVWETGKHIMDSHNWKRSVASGMGEKVSPRNDINAPDLYIPLMSFITYVLLISLFYGINSTFSPELFGKLSLSGLITTAIEILIYKFLFYLMSSNIKLPWLDFLAYTGYKFTGILLPSIIGILLGNKIYLVVLIVTSIPVGYFLVSLLFIF
ncbi:yip1 interacting factor [Anaeramoeba flamelloides]|uniref:Protein YIF1 n=1 Tax=Anaeramoeba flamelloides TaxID=1746091 RepID=A0AAV7YR59_9EUKA|nr:yip1 interacting factor [Anaeramoeba flamelloides]